MFFNCPVCRGNDEGGFFSGDKVTCPRCGIFRISEDAASKLIAELNKNKRKIANASGWVREHQDEVISASDIETLLNLPTPSINERALRLLQYIEKKTEILGQKISGCDTASPSLDFYAAAWAADHTEFAYIIRYLKSLEYIDGVSITPKGFAYLDQIKYSNLDSQIGFCAMWFDDSVKHIWTQAIFPAISDAGYEPKRIDEHHHNNRIDDEIIALIRRSKFVVADFTGQRGGVYFEAGFALGMNLPVIWTVKKSELASVHFDNRQYNFVVWEEDKLSEFKLNLQYRIEATLGRGTWKPDA